jgi:hypothetical protein
MSLFQLLENKDTHYLLFYYSFTNMSMNSFVAYESRRVVEGGLPYITGRLGMDIVVILIIYSKRSRYCAKQMNLPFNKLQLPLPGCCCNKFVLIFSVENIGVEPMTSCLQSRRSSQLS